MATKTKKPAPKAKKAKVADAEPILLSLDMDQIVNMIHGGKVYFAGNTTADVEISMEEIDQTRDIDDAIDQLQNAWEQAGFDDEDGDEDEDEDEDEDDLDDDDDLSHSDEDETA